MLISNPGSVNFWFDPKNNVFAFKEGNNVLWGDIEINDEHAKIMSEGQTLFVVMNPNTGKEISIFKTQIDPDFDKEHMVTITWSSEKLCLYFDGALIQEVQVTDFQ